MQPCFEGLLAHCAAHKAPASKHQQLWRPCRSLWKGGSDRRQAVWVTLLAAAVRSPVEQTHCLLL